MKNRIHQSGCLATRVTASTASYLLRKSNGNWKRHAEEIYRKDVPVILNQPSIYLQMSGDH